MRLFFSRNRPKIKVESVKKDSFSGWIKCSGCQEIIHAKELQKNLNCCQKCNHHYRISVKQRIELLADKKSFEEKFSNLKTEDPLDFVDSKPYKKRIRDAKEKSKSDEAIKVGTCRIEKMKVALGVMDFSFMGGSMGSVVGERLTLLIEHACDNKLPLVIVSSSGGARMQESVLSLMQMAKTSAALARLDDLKIPFISVLTNPTTGGVIASFASLGDIIIAEPDALIAFAGPRVVEQTIKEKLPKGAQRSEFLLEKGMIDCIANRKDLKKKIAFFLEFLKGDLEPFDKLKDLLKIQKKLEKK
jgi:acetyl-CoA carboxylase carboxyl transferase subunit beta